MKPLRKLLPRSRNRARWVGPPLELELTAAAKDESSIGSPPPVGRRKHYGAVELAGSHHKTFGEQVNVNDVVEIADQATEAPTRSHPALVQVLSMWQDTLTGESRFHGRYLVYASDLPEGALARFQAARARAACLDESSSDYDSTGSFGGFRAEQTVDNNNSDTDSGGGKKGQDEEVFLTVSKTKDLDISSVVRTITLSVAARVPTTATPAKGGVALVPDPGPRLSHAFDSSTGDFVPVKRTDAIVKRARARRTEAAARVARIAEDASALRSGRERQQSGGWMLPKRSLLEVTRAGLGAGARADGDESSPATDIAEGQIGKKGKPEDAQQSRSAKENDGEGDSCGNCPADEEVEQVLDHRIAAPSPAASNHSTTGEGGAADATSLPGVDSGGQTGEMAKSEGALLSPSTEESGKEGGCSDSNTKEAAAAGTSMPDAAVEGTTCWRRKYEGSFQSHAAEENAKGGNYGDCTTTPVPDAATEGRAGDISTPENALRPPGSTEGGRGEGSYSDGTDGEATAAAATSSLPGVDSEGKADETRSSEAPLKAGGVADTREGGSYSYSNDGTTDEATPSATSLPDVDREEKAGETRSPEGPLRPLSTEESGDGDNYSDGSTEEEFQQPPNHLSATTSPSSASNDCTIDDQVERVPQVRAAATSPAASDDRTTAEEMEQAPENRTASTSPAASVTVTSASPEPVAQPPSQQQTTTQPSLCHQGGTDRLSREIAVSLLTTAPVAQRHQESAAAKGRGPPPERSRRLALPPVAGNTKLVLISEVEEVGAFLLTRPAPTAAGETSVSARTLKIPDINIRNRRAVHPLVWRLPSSKKTQRDGSPGPPSITAKRRRRRSVGISQEEGQPLKYPRGGALGGGGGGGGGTLVVKDSQADIPELRLGREEAADGGKIEQPSSAGGAQKVWRGARDRDRDARSRGVPHGYLDAARKDVRAKEPRPGVAVQIRPSARAENKTRCGDQGGGGVRKLGASRSYAAWALTQAEPRASGDVRVTCSETVQTEVPRSAIQRAQVRRLEKALEGEFDPSARVKDSWAREGVDLSRAELVNLAKVAEEFPDKTPAQVIYFYHRYLAAAKPLTDTAFGSEAPRARKQYPGGPDMLPRRPSKRPRSHSNTATASAPIGTPLRTSASLAIDLSGSPCSGSRAAPPSAETSSKPSEPRASRLGASGQAEEGEQQKQVPSAGLPSWKSSGWLDGPSSGGGADPDERRRTGRIRRLSASDSTACQAHPRSAIAVDPFATTSRSPRPASRAGFLRSEAGRGGGGGGGGGRVIGRSRASAAHEAQQPQRRRHERGTAGVLLCGSEMQQMAGGDEATGKSCTSRATPPAVRGHWMTLLQRSGVGSDPGVQPLANGAPPASSPEGLSRGGAVLSEAQDRIPVGTRFLPVRLAADSTATAEDTGWRPAPFLAPSSPPSGFPAGGGGVAGHSDIAGHSNSRGEGTRAVRFHQPRPATRSAAGGRVSSGESRRVHVLGGGGGGGGGDGGGGSAHVARLLVHRDVGQVVEADPVEGLETFGSMAPCWRLVERAKAYMTLDERQYMIGLILAHVRTPMSRDQLLERAKSCLQDRGHIFAAFVKMFDRIEHAPIILPFFAGRRPSPTNPPPEARPVLFSAEGPASHAVLPRYHYHPPFATKRDHHRPSSRLATPGLPRGGGGGGGGSDGDFRLRTNLYVPRDGQVSMSPYGGGGGGHGWHGNNNNSIFVVGEGDDGGGDGSQFLLEE